MDNMTGGNKMEHEQHSSINDILHHYKEGIGSFTNQIPEITETYNAFTQACFQEGALTKREKQLIALGISLATQDEYCTIYHTKGCLDQGCSDKEILEACGVSAAFAGGAAMSQAVTLVQECLTELKNQKH
ncbi:carboxymuconolactone decarboxylase family protein [Bacillus cereus]|uniref:carboxymuconolactone decarboxylase family protein n=1 Tax=Bacillus cereus TaxID=1396 RepID=UPI0018A85C1B|nr:carboxymuconolactone decarboxylase family protein [Bacillus cereus]MEB9903310.1 carboxymuconolactone decarboxylase family protein [Bacillus cereus]MEC0052283.1 carboxymuconolactone decarboxylase family protein [Bacillus cereus]MEC0217254.1 carboxymuconolactone decarboxylase family protein [Bacillus cereus]MEC2793796.1 carboxymuconolactone decarboxylase family protein [Bacillus cereus]MEC2861110.1 carboxymuconolactone decarboxylase family protein [Bacillus cereus]